MFFFSNSLIVVWKANIYMNGRRYLKEVLAELYRCSFSQADVVDKYAKTCFNLTGYRYLTYYCIILFCKFHTEFELYK